MIKNIDNPLIIVRLAWLPKESGGRRAGPPNTEGVYASTCRFELWPNPEQDAESESEAFSILLQRVVDSSEEWQYKATFLAPELVESMLKVGRKLVVTEGLRKVAFGEIIKVPNVEEKGGVIRRNIN
ncbi:hypothetical protein GCM10022198_11140 [Klugiella xanthotipulae]|uniref:Uncharacterized protein n=1 Tax=Klugiella xanthotipulae TaxID=244735 RepID=A0A543HYW7_9MICO|nr:hypothetical protein [Klugiella xanthotipulae]TQM63508.1 hypothetical protein FB466_1773 [Klugiella xanthotipulae]